MERFRQTDGVHTNGYTGGIDPYSPEGNEEEMTPIEIIDIMTKLANIGLAPVLLIGMWKLWGAYQELVDDLRKINERLDIMLLKENKSQDGNPPWD